MGEYPHMSPDLINGGFELLSSAMMVPSIIRAWRARKITGVHWTMPVFFVLWGVWNIFYYPHLGQWFSLLGAIMLLITNSLWLMLVVAFYSDGGDHGK